MKNFVIFLLLGVYNLSLYAQENTLTPIFNKNTKLYGFKDSNNNMIVDYKYEEYSNFEDVICVVRQSKVGFIDVRGVEIIPCEYSYENQVYSDKKVIFLSKNGLYGLADFKGNILTPFKYEAGYGTIQDFLCVRQNGKWGLISLETGKEVIPPIYEALMTASPLYENPVITIYNPHQSKIISAKKNGKWGFIDLKGNTTIPFIYEDDKDSHVAYKFVYGVCIVKKNNNFGLINLKGNIVIPCKYKSIVFPLNNIDDKIYIVTDYTGKEAVFSYTGEQLCGFYDEIEKTNEQRAIFKLGGKYGLINLILKKEVTPAKYDEIDYISENYARVKKGNLYGYVNTTTGIETFKCEFEDGSFFANGYCAIKKNGRWGYIKANGYSGIYIPCEYDECGTFKYDNLAVIEKGGMKGCINTKGMMVIPCIYKSLDNFDQVGFTKRADSPEEIYRLANTKTGDSNEEAWGYLDSEGKEIIECKYTKQIATDLLHTFWKNNAVPDVDENIPINSIKNTSTYVLIIANENYDESSISQAAFAHNDGFSFKNYCTKTLGIPLENIKYIEDATLNKIRYGINWISNIVKVQEKQPNVIFYYSGHGVPDETSRNAYLLPSDGLANDSQSGYSLDLLYKQLGELHTNKTIVLLDACFSGTTREGEMMTMDSKGVAIKSKPVQPKGNMVVLSAAQGDETAYPYKKKKHGMFTYFLLKKLQETKGNASLGDLESYINKKVSQQSIIENGKKQTPSINISTSVNADWKTFKIY